MKFYKEILYKSRSEYYKLIYRKLLNSNESLIGSKKREKCLIAEEILSTHFGTYTDINHPCKETLSTAILELGEKPANIIETGSSAWGTNSSMLFDLYVYSFGGSFNTVDIRIDPAIYLSKKSSEFSNFWCDDSVNWLKKVGNICSKPINLAYLDSWDLDLDRAVESAIHGLNEFLTLLPFLSKGSLVLIDDTPMNEEIAIKVQGKDWAKKWIESKKKYGFPPGKGSLIKQYVEYNSIGKLIKHDYQLLIKI